MSVKKENARAQTIHLRLHAFPQLPPLRHFPQEVGDPKVEGRIEDRDGHKLAEDIKARLLQAFRGEWQSLVADLLHGAQCEQGVPLRFPTEMPPHVCAQAIPPSNSRPLSTAGGVEGCARPKTTWSVAHRPTRRQQQSNISVRITGLSP